MNIEEHPLFLEQLKRHEGTRRDRKGRHKAYRCPAGALTIGWGHNLDARPVEGLGLGSVISDDAAEALLFEDCSMAAQELDWRLPWWRTLDEARAAVLLNMVFNLGIGRLLGFRRTLEAVQERRFDAAAAAMLHSRWAGQVKRRAVELSVQMRTGLWQGKRLKVEAGLEVSAEVGGQGKSRGEGDAPGESGEPRVEPGNCGKGCGESGELRVGGKSCGEVGA